MFGYGSLPVGPVRLDVQEPDALARARFGPATVTRDDVVLADGDGALFVRQAALRRCWSPPARSGRSSATRRG